MKEEAKARVYELAERLLDEEAHLRELQNSIDSTQRRILEIKGEMHHIIELNKPNVK